MVDPVNSSPGQADERPAKATQREEPQTAQESGRRVSGYMCYYRDISANGYVDVYDRQGNKPGGTIGMINWTPEGFIGNLFKTMKPYAPPPPPGASPPPL